MHSIQRPSEIICCQQVLCHPLRVSCRQSGSTRHRGPRPNRLLQCAHCMIAKGCQHRSRVPGVGLGALLDGLTRPPIIKRRETMMEVNGSDHHRPQPGASHISWVMSHQPASASSPSHGGSWVVITRPLHPVPPPLLGTRCRGPALR